MIRARYGLIVVGAEGNWSSGVDACGGEQQSAPARPIDRTCHVG